MTISASPLLAPFRFALARRQRSTGNRRRVAFQAIEQAALSALADAIEKRLEPQGWLLALAKNTGREPMLRDKGVKS